MDVFTNPALNTYLTWKIFLIPSNTTAGTKGIAVSQKHFQYLNSIYTIIIAGIFGFVWQFAIHVALVLYPTEERPRHKDQEKDGVSELDTGNRLEIRKRKANRYVSLIIIWNAPNPWAAVFQLCSHAFNMIFYANDRETSIYDIAAIGFAILVGASTALGSTIIPSYLRRGSVAPANPVAVFFVSPPLDKNFSSQVRFQQAIAPSVRRAIGIVEFASQAVQERVNVHPIEIMDWAGPNGETIDRTTYEYSVTGFDFGLQHKNAKDFVAKTKGACTLEYNFFDQSLSDNLTDVYSIYGHPVYISLKGIYRPPGGLVVPNATLRGDDDDWNITYSIVPDSAGRISRSEGEDPWYSTGKTSDPLYYGVKNQRPVLSCWQQDTWSYQGHIAKSIVHLDTLPGLNLPDIIRGFIGARLSNPVMFDVGDSLGASILLSSTGGMGYIFDASTSNHTADLERLITTSYVVTRNILRDTTMMANDTRLRNNAADASDKPVPGTGDFVVTSGDVVSLSLVTLIVVPLVWALLWVVRFIVSLNTNPNKNSGALSRLTLRALCFQPVQMYRLIDELLCGYRDDWFGRKGEMPYIKTAKEVRISKNKPGRAPSMVEQMDVEGEETVAPGAPAGTSFPLFAAPKVVPGPDGKNHIRFTGPMERQKSADRWSIRKSRPGSMVVVGEPAGETVEEQVRKFLATETASEEQLPLLHHKKSAPSV